MHYNFSQLPLLKLLLPLLAGILIFNAFSFSFFPLSILIVVAFGILLIAHFYVQSINQKRYISILIYLLLFLFGGWMITANQLENNKNHFSKKEGLFVRGIISQPLEEKEKTFKTVVQLTTIIDSNTTSTRTNGNLLLYIVKDSTLKKLEIGDEILCRLNYTTVSTPKNIGEFNYKNYLSHKGVFQQQYAPVSDVRILEKHKEKAFLRLCAKMRNWAQEQLFKYIPKTENAALAAGILLGYKSAIDIDLYNAFTYTGILHILSVSGLHVGIIYAMLLFLLSFIKDKNLRVQRMKFVFIVVCIWLFAFITGFSAACVRAAILFTLMNFGKINKENYNNLNLLAGAALIQIVLDPNNVFDIGFQLSYLAMLGLFLFTKPIQAMLFYPNKVAIWIAQLWAASIAAQLFTTPLSIYYFGNFPVYFLIANIFAIPLSAVILWLSVALLPFAHFSPIANLIGVANSFIIDAFVYLTELCVRLPFGKMNNLYLSKFQLIILFFALILFVFYMLQKQAKFLLLALSLIFTTILISYSYTINQYKKEKLIFYSVAKNNVIAFNVNQTQYLLSKESLSDKAFNFSVKNSHRIFRISNFKPTINRDTALMPKFLIQNEILFIKDKSIFLLSKQNTRKVFEKPLDIDYLLITDNCFLNIEDVKRNFNAKRCLIGCDNNVYHQKIYEKLLIENKISFINLNKQNFIVEI